MTQETSSRRRPRAAQIAAEAGAVALSAAIVAGMGAYATRRDLAQGMAEQWLRDQGIPGVLRVEQLDADGFSGSLLIGPEADPDLKVDRVEVDLALEPAWADERFKVSARAVRLVRPQLKAELGDGGLTFGRLDPVVRDFLARPPDEDAVGPVVLIEDGSVRLATDYGAVRLSGSGAIDDGRLVRFDGRTAPAQLRGEGLSADLGAGAVRLAGQGQRLTGRATLDVNAWSGGAVTVQDGALTLDVDAPYPEGEGADLDGPLVVEAALDAASLSAAGAQGRRVRAKLNFGGRAEGELTSPTFAGAATLRASAATLTGQGLDGRQLVLEADTRRLTLARTKDGGRLTIAGGVDATADLLTTPQGRLEQARLDARSAGATLTLADGVVSGAGPVLARLRARRIVRPGLTATAVVAEAETDLRLFGGPAPLRTVARAERLTTKVDGRTVAVSDAAARFAGSARTRGGFAWNADGSASARGGFEAADAAALARRVPVLSGETSHKDDLERALAAFDLRAPALSLAVAPGRTTLSSGAALRLDARSGARLALTGRPLFRLAGSGTSGEATLTAEGGGLPTLSLALNGWRAGAGGFDSPVRLSGRGLDAAIARDATVEASGRARLAAGRFSFEAAGCIPVTAAEIEFGESDLTGAAADVCPTAGAPLIVADAAGYRLRGRFQRAGLTWPVTETLVSEGKGGFDARGGAVGLTNAAVRLGAATLTDAGLVKRYEPLRLSGGIDLASGVWRGRFDGATLAGVRLGAADVTHAEATGVGSAVIDARGLTFAEDGLQPGDITPLIAGISTGATGAIDFTGRFDWAEAGTTSSGRLTTQGLNFTSPAGAVSAVDADVVLVSLTPLISAPDQRMTVSKLDALAEVTDLVTVFTLLEDEIRLASTEFDVAGGRVRLEPLVIPLRENATYTGVMHVDDVQLGQLIEAVNLGRSVDLDAVVDGRIPFEVGPGRVRFADGTLTSTRPGRIEIKREALTAVAAEGAAAPGAPVAPAAPVNAIQDFAYQAMENLSFQQLDVRVNSLPEGRLGLLFKVRGEHDPELAEEARVGILDVIRGRAFDRRIPLPKGTPVNLTLDTTLNFDELLEAWLQVARSRAAQANASKPERSEAVQPPPPRKNP